ncbi:unnamed protein product [Caenorhabditis bovis]|uniref:Uncharacterized protein n=1 Tax=Caenorhabditis bovis TaxID=2654633 RepID=A0A8S1FCK0_9PELO|nr:unnamed protein product [Caenorhabditis bovis]
MKSTPEIRNLGELASAAVPHNVAFVRRDSDRQLNTLDYDAVLFVLNSIETNFDDVRHLHQMTSARILLIAIEAIESFYYNLANYKVPLRLNVEIAVAAAKSRHLIGRVLRLYKDATSNDNLGLARGDDESFLCYDDIERSTDEIKRAIARKYSTSLKAIFMNILRRLLSQAKEQREYSQYNIIALKRWLFEKRSLIETLKKQIGVKNNEISN